MGAVLGKFRKAKTTEQQLEKLEERIKEMENFSLNTREKQRRVVGNFVAISIGCYVIAALAFYFVYLPPTWTERAIYLVPLLLFPVVIILLRAVFTWYFQRKLNRNSDRLSTLRAEKKKLLEQVMDKETYKVAVNLLNRFGDRTTTSIRPNVAATPRNTKPGPRLTISQTPRPFGSPAVPNPSMALVATPARPGAMGTSLPGSNRALAVTSSQLSLGAGQELRQRRTAFPILDQRNKSVFERMVDVLIGDGPQDRFAMICKECHGHNGMALKEDFEYTTFRCAFCSTLNPSRKSRPVAPKLPDQTSFVINRRGSSSSSSSDNESEDEGASMQLSDSDTPLNKDNPEGSKNADADGPKIVQNEVTVSPSETKAPSQEEEPKEKREESQKEEEKRESTQKEEDKREEPKLVEPYDTQPSPEPEDS